MEPPTCGWRNFQGSLWTLVWMHTAQLENISRLFTLCFFFSVKLYRWGIGRLREGRGLAGCLASDLLYFSVCWSKLLNRRRLSTPPHCSRSWNITYCPEFINTLQAALCVHSTVLTTVSVARTEAGHDTRGLYQIKDWNSQKKKKKRRSEVKAQLEFLWFIQTVKTIPWFALLFCPSCCEAGHPGRAKVSFWSLPLNILFQGVQGFLYNVSLWNIVFIH